MLLEQIVQLSVIIAGIFGGISWLMSFLQKKFLEFKQDLLRVQEKMDNKVTQDQCKQRRTALPCCMGDGTFRCPLPDAQTKELTETLKKLSQALNSFEKHN